MDQRSEGSECTCRSEQEHAAMVRRIDESYRQDARRAKEAPTSWQITMRARAKLNGHG
jgi:hypothetical protein